MLLLSRLTDRDVREPGGDPLGRLADLTVRLGADDGPHLVERILVRRGDHAALIPWSAVAGVRHRDITLRSADFCGTPADALDDDEILLVRDVLDTQVVDIVGNRLARVADVVLARTDHRLELVGVEVGFAGVLRRLGLHRLATGVGADAVAWADLHLTSERGHAVQLATPRSAVHHLDARGLAALVSRLDTESAADVLATTGPEVAAEVIRAAHPVVGERVLRALPGTHAERIMAAMPTDHAARWEDRLGRAAALRGRQFLRWRVWPRHRHLPTRSTR